ncbi:hypothetical protein [Burkholderia sp. Ac-20365]|uniref:hypothetical protein n=1 Tax=Burkholderia sp. Ac-20365 TaxID=2703897 RepID=UPI00197BF028|nr:hypothetical protein [Burkholderia sp. Ac-20365]MBN3762102.1 hypothetical protein [Burkholderia sp. Ac-20365]
MRRCASVFATLIMASTAATLVSAAIRYEPDSAPPPAASEAMAGVTESQQADLEQLLQRHGIDPGSNKARIILAWVEKIQRDPVIASDAHRAQRVGQIFLDPRAREEFMSNGIAHLTPADRLQYVKLLTRFLDELVPVNCFGLDDMRAVMNRVSLRDMSDADVDQYFGLLYKVLVNDTSSAPVPTPTPQQTAMAERQLTRTLITELRGDEASIERFAYYASNPTLATPSDVCWTTRVTLHAIIAMPDPDRDVVLLRTMAPRKAQDVLPARRLGSPATAIPPTPSSGTVRAP